MKETRTRDGSQGFPRLSRITAKSKGHWGGAGGIQERGLCLGEFYSQPASHLELRTPHLKSQRPLPSGRCEKGHESNPFYKSILFLRNTEEPKRRDKERRCQGPSDRSPHSLPRKGLPISGSQTTCLKLLPEPWLGSWHRVHSKTFENTPQPWGRKCRNKTSGSRRYSVQFKYDPELWRGDI